MPSSKSYYCGVQGWFFLNIAPLTWYEITDLTGYSRTQGSKILNDALIEFAWAFADNEDLRAFK